MVSQHIKKNNVRPTMVDIELNVTPEGFAHTQLYIERLERVIRNLVDLHMLDDCEGRDRDECGNGIVRCLLNDANS